MTTPDKVSALGPNELMDPALSTMDPDDFQGNQENLATLREGCARMLSQLAQMGLEVPFQTTMLKEFFNGLVYVGALTKAQMCLIELRWESQFHAHLKQQVAQAEDMAQKAHARQTLLGGGFAPRRSPQAAPKILLPGQN